MPPIKILILATNPKTTTGLRLEEEVRELKESFRRSMQREQFDLYAIWATRPRDVIRAILDFDPDIVHFTGHGEETAIVFENETGESQFVSDEALADLFKLFSNSVKSVVLNACYSESQARAIAQHIPFVVGTRSGIGNRAAIEFAIGFYDALGAGKSIDFAYRLGLNAIQLLGIPGDLAPILINNKIFSKIESPEQVSTIEVIKQEVNLPQQYVKPFEFIKSPYRSGNLIQELEQGNTEMFFGRDETILQLKQILIDHDDSLVILYGQRRTGKSCLMKYIQKKKIFETNLAVIFTDMQGLLSEQRFYESVLSQIQETIQANQKINTHVNSFDDFADSLNTLLQRVSTGILIMIDELECITNKHFKYTSISDGYEFLQRIRSLIQHTPLVKFALAGTNGLRAMINDYQNPLFKAGRTLHIAFLHSQDARNLIIKPLVDTVSYTEEAITLIQEATFNHPYFIQCLCQRLIDILNENERYLITETEVKQAIDDLQKIETDMFEYVWEITDQIDHIALSIIAQEIKGRTWISIDQIEKILTDNNYQIQGYILDTSIKKLIQKDIVIESNSGLEYTIPIGLLRTWLQRYKPLSRVRREFSVYQRESLPS